MRQRTSRRNDFGFSLRKAIRVENSNGGAKIPTIFAEPSTGGGEETGLLTGDRLIAVNDQLVENVSREVIIEMIKNCNDSVKVTVQPVAELVEISVRCIDAQNEQPNNIVSHSMSDCNTLRRSASKRFSNKVSKRFYSTGKIFFARLSLRRSIKTFNFLQKLTVGIFVEEPCLSH